MPRPSTFREAALFKMPFGKYKDKTLDEIGESDPGLKYLDWLRGQKDDNGDEPDTNDVHGALTVYLDDATIKKELTKL